MIGQTTDSGLAISGFPATTGSPQPVGHISAVPALARHDEKLRESKIMIVDDEPINLMVAQKYLSLEGYRNFVTISESRTAVEMVKNTINMRKPLHASTMPSS